MTQSEFFGIVEVKFALGATRIGFDRSNGVEFRWLTFFGMIRPLT
jgi:hypothetical protein